jgi:23S rRNA (cytidine1920-2'-O)/16S rRNA (cytidine1409-2'-O)-methyltransferase
MSEPAMRLDQLLVQRGLFRSREQARRAVRDGVVAVDGRTVDKPSRPVAEDSPVQIRGTAEPFVSRAGSKLAAALDAFAVDPAGWICLDVGASTGGFTDCLLQRGAARVYALDVGHDQLDERLRRDPRVIVYEGVNARYLEPDFLPEPVQLATFDLSFISVLKVVPAVLPLVAEGGLLIALLKPQFEVGRSGVGKGGVVRDEARRRRVLEERREELSSLGLRFVGRVDSPVPGKTGNREELVCFQRPAVDRS